MNMMSLKSMMKNCKQDIFISLYKRLLDAGTIVVRVAGIGFDVKTMTVASNMMIISPFLPEFALFRLAEVSFHHLS
jgi:hypothetical protein